MKNTREALVQRHAPEESSNINPLSTGLGELHGSLEGGYYPLLGIGSQILYLNLECIFGVAISGSLAKLG